MENLHFIDSEGNTFSKKDVNKHHVFFIRPYYRTPFERKFREQHGSVLAILKSAHEELHLNVEPPVKPNINLMRDIYNYVRNTYFETSHDRFYEMLEYIEDVANNGNNQRNVEDANVLLENLYMQEYYISVGRVVLQRGTSQ